MSVASGLSATKTGLDLARSVYNLLTQQEVNPAEIQARLLELQALILEAQRALGDAEEENRQLKRQFEERKEQERIQGELVFAENVYLRRDAQGSLEGPFCTVCWDENRKLVRLISKGEGEWAGVQGRMIRYDCIVHKLQVFLRPEVMSYRPIK